MTTGQNTSERREKLQWSVKKSVGEGTGLFPARGKACGVRIEGNEREDAGKTSWRQNHGNEPEDVANLPASKRNGLDKIRETCERAGELADQRR